MKPGTLQCAVNGHCHLISGSIKRSSVLAGNLSSIRYRPIALRPAGECRCDLLRVLETGLFMRCGNEPRIASDVRVVAATNRIRKRPSPRASCARTCITGTNVFPVELPPLRERGDDVILITQRYLDMLNKGTQGGQKFAVDTLESLHRPYLAGECARTEELRPSRVHPGRRQ